MAESRYNSSGVPSREELEQLPRWAVVAFAARCALRVQPLFKHAWPDAPEEHIEAIDTAIRRAQVAAAAPASAGDSYAGGNAVFTVNAATDYAEAALAAGAAANAAFAVVINIVATDGTDIGLAAAHAAGAADDACVAGAAVNARVDVATAMRRDFDLLKAASQEDGWDDDTAVPPEFFGPLWPEGEPEDWPEDERGIPEPFSFVLDPGDADTETITEVLSALSELHEVHTGYALQYQIEGSRVMACAEVVA